MEDRHLLFLLLGSRLVRMNGESMGLDFGEDSAAVLTPSVLIGTWFSDCWVSPYVKFRFLDLPDYVRQIRFEVFRPNLREALAEPQCVALRSGTRLLLEYKFPAQKKRYDHLDISLPVTTSLEPFDLTLRSSLPLRPSKPDTRRLGVMLLAIRGLGDV